MSPRLGPEPRSSLPQLTTPAPLSPGGPGGTAVAQPVTAAPSRRVSWTRARRALVTLVRHGVVAARVTARVTWVVSRLCAVAVARTLVWLAAEPARIRTAALGVLVSAVIGAGVGAAVGLALSAAVHGAISVVVGQPG